MKKIILIGIALVAAGIAYYGLSPLWNTIKLDEAQPIEKNSEEKEIRKAPIVETPLHPASGEVSIIESEGKKYVRYENYKTINGPDIFVYLSKDLEGKDYIDLGRVRATEGNINYEIPNEVNPDDYRYVLTWCKKFGVLFNSAEINPEN